MGDYWFSSQVMAASRYSAISTNPDAITTKYKQLEWLTAAEVQRGRQHWLALGLSSLEEVCRSGAAPACPQACAHGPGTCVGVGTERAFPEVSRPVR